MKKKLKYLSYCTINYKREKKIKYSLDKQAPRKQDQNIILPPATLELNPREEKLRLRISEDEDSGTDKIDETENFRLHSAPTEWLKNMVETGIKEVVSTPK